MLTPLYGSPETTFRGRCSAVSGACQGMCHFPAPASIALMIVSVIAAYTLGRRVPFSFERTVSMRASSGRGKHRRIPVLPLPSEAWPLGFLVREEAALAEVRERKRCSFKERHAWIFGHPELSRWR